MEGTIHNIWNWAHFAIPMVNFILLIGLLIGKFIMAKEILKNRADITQLELSTQQKVQDGIDAILNKLNSIEKASKVIAIKRPK